VTEHHMQAGWDAAVDSCLNGHDDCSYGGMTPATGYWLCSEYCSGDHLGVCAWCPAEATTGFAGWGDDGWSLWQVLACEEHGAAWAAGHPEWTRDRPESSGKTAAEVLAEWRARLSPGARLAADAMDRAMDDALLYGTGPRPDEPGFDGIGALMKNILDAPEAPGGPPFTYAFRHPEPEEVEMEGEDGEMVLVERIPLLPSFTIERRPSFTGILGYLADQGGERR